MKIIIRLSLLMLFLIGNRSESFSQIWPISPWIRFGNTVYYDIDSLTVENLTGTSIIMDKEITNRYVDILLESDSIGLIINDSVYYFTQKKKSTPRCYKEFIFYKRMRLTSNNLSIKYLELIDISHDTLTVNALIRNSDDRPRRKHYNQIAIPRDDISGVFLGIGPDARKFIAIFTGTCIVVVFVISEIT